MTVEQVDTDERLELATGVQMRIRLQMLEAGLTEEARRRGEMLHDVRQNTKRAQAAHGRLDVLAAEDLKGIAARLEALEAGQAELLDKLQKLRDWAVKKFEHNGNGATK